METGRPPKVRRSETDPVVVQDQTSEILSPEETKTVVKLVVGKNRLKRTIPDQSLSPAGILMYSIGDCDTKENICAY